VAKQTTFTPDFGENILITSWPHIGVYMGSRKKALVTAVTFYQNAHRHRHFLPKLSSSPSLFTKTLTVTVTFYQDSHRHRHFLPKLSPSPSLFTKTGMYKNLFFLTLFISYAFPGIQLLLFLLHELELSPSLFTRS